MPYQLIVFAVLALAPFATYGWMAVKLDLAVARSYKEGVTAGKEQAAAQITQHSQQTVAKVGEGEREAQPAPSDLAKRQALCNRMASCRDRKQGGT